MRQLLLQKFKILIIITAILFTFTLFSLPSFLGTPSFADFTKPRNTTPPPAQQIIPNEPDPYLLSEASFSIQQPNADNYVYNDLSKVQLYESVESWRTEDSFAPTYPPGPHERPEVPHWSSYSSKGEYLKQPLVADYANGTDKVYLMIKTGADVLWNRLPMHLLTTLTRVPNFGLYSDKASSIGGYEVIDILANVSDETIQDWNFDKYRKMTYLRNLHNVHDPSEVKIDGGWNLDKFKNIPMLAHAYSVSPESDWYVFMDADSYVFWDVMMKWLNTLNPKDFLYMGSTEWNGHSPFAHGGSVVVLSRTVLEETIVKHPEYILEYEKRARGHCCGDILLAEMIKDKTGNTVSRGNDYPGVNYRFQGRSFWNLKIAPYKWCQTVQTFHHLAAHEIEILYEYEKLRGPHRDELVFYDIYRDFYLPYIDNKLDHWDNMAKNFEWTEKTTNPLPKEGVYPYKSFDECKIACEANGWCLSYRYIPDKKYCGLSKYVRLGKPVLLEWPNKDRDEFKDTKKDKDEYHDITSGYMIDRIREFRKTQVCDALFKSEVDEKPDASENDFYEGWFLRRTKKQEQERMKQREQKKEEKKQ